MAWHDELTGDDAIHEIMYVQSSDPGAVGAFKFWLDTTGGATLDAGAILKQRDSGDSAWTTRLDLATALAAKQSLDAELTALAGLVSAANKLPLFTGSGTADLLNFSTDGTMAGNSDSNVPSEKAIRSYIASVITGGASNVMIFQGVIDCSANPNYPAADAGDVYKVSVAGKIGGASGRNVEVGDTLYCITDSTASGDQATVGAEWVIVQENIDGAVVGPASATNNHVVLFDGATGKQIKDSGALFQFAALTDVNLGALSDGDVLTWDAASSKWINAAPTGGGGGAGTRTTATVTTASLANNAIENGTVTLAKWGHIGPIEVDRDCWIRLYATAADRTADAGRVIGTPAAATTDILAEWSFASGVPGGNNQKLRRLGVDYFNGDSTPTADIYYAIANKCGSTSTVQVIFTHLPLET